MILPPAVPPNWGRFKLSRFGCRELLNTPVEDTVEMPFGRALRSPLRRNPNKSPWKALAPDLVTPLTTQPGCSPYCAGRPLTCTLNSATASGKGIGRATLLNASLLSPPSNRKLMPLACDPATENWPEPPAVP